MSAARRIGCDRGRRRGYQRGSLLFRTRRGRGLGCNLTPIHLFWPRPRNLRRGIPAKLGRIRRTRPGPLVSAAPARAPKAVLTSALYWTLGSSESRSLRSCWLRTRSRGLLSKKLYRARKTFCLVGGFRSRAVRRASGFPASVIDVVGAPLRLRSASAPGAFG